MKISVSTYGKIAVVACFAGCIGDFAVTFIIGFMNKNYNFLTQSESYLGTNNSPVAMYMNAWGVVFSVLFVSCAYCLYRAIPQKNRWQVIAASLIAVYGLGEGIGSGLFPYNHAGSELTVSGKLHTLFSGIGVTALMLLPFILLKAFPKRTYGPLNAFFVFVAVSGALFVIAFLLAKQDILPWKGLWQRLFLLDYYLMLITLTLHVAKLRKSSGFHNIV